jgi:hypothetical protein
VSYRKWMKKWQVVIFWAIAAAFVVGIGWWSAAFYIRSKSSSSEANTPDLDYLARYSVAYLVKGATDTSISSLTFLRNMSIILALEDVDYGVGTIEPTSMWIETADFEKVYPSVKMYYENAYLSRTLDPVFEDYQLRAETVAYMGFMNMLRDYQSVEPVPSSTPSTDEVIEYFNENATSLAPMYSEYHLKVVTLDSTQLIDFQKDLLTLGFEEAASKVGQEAYDLGNMTGEQALNLGIDEKVVKEMYEVGESGVVGPQPYGSGWIFVEVVESTPIRNANDLTGDQIDSLRNKIVVQRIDDYLDRMKMYYEKRGEAIVINDDVLRFWYEFYRSQGLNDIEDLLKLDEKVKKYVLKNGGEVNVESLSTLQALYVLILETEKSWLTNMKSMIQGKVKSEELDTLKKAFGDLTLDEIDRKVEKIDEIRKKIVSNLYYEGYKVYGVLLRMTEFFDDPKYKLELAEVSAEGKKEIATRVSAMYGVNIQQIMNNFMPEIQTFFGVSQTSESTPLKLRAMEDAYDLLKFLGIYEAASSTLSDIKQASPTYKGWNFDEKFKELEELIKPATPTTSEKESTPSITLPSTEASE